MPPTMSMVNDLGLAHFIIMFFIVTITLACIALFK